MMPCNGRVRRIPAALLLSEDGPEIFRMRITAVQEGLAAVRPRPFEAGVGIAVTRDDVVARLQLPFDQKIQPRMQLEPEGFRGERGQRAARKINEQAEGGMQAGDFGRQAIHTAPRAHGNEPQELLAVQRQRLVVVDGCVTRRGDDKLAHGHSGYIRDWATVIKRNAPAGEAGSDSLLNGNSVRSCPGAGSWLTDFRLFTYRKNRALLPTHRG